jgi:hypothetical protein
MLARKCATHLINRPDPKVRDMEIKKHKPKMKEQCPGYGEIEK